jgi:hypothetical protein
MNKTACIVRGVVAFDNWLHQVDLWAGGFAPLLTPKVGSFSAFAKKH